MTAQQRLADTEPAAGAAQAVLAGAPARSKALRSAVGRGVEELVGRTSAPEYRRLLLDALSTYGHVLGTNPDRAIWPLFPLVTYEALTDRAAPALAAAVAIEVFAAAADLFDDLEDGDLAGPLAGRTPGEVVNAASGLLMLAQAALLEGNHPEVPPHRWARAARILAEAAFIATTGQAADLAAERAPSLSVDDCLAIARDKAGALVGAACQIGAALATDDDRVIALVGEFGTCLGITQQVLNDLNDLRPDAERGWKSDLARRKKTVPIAYALHMLDSSAHQVSSSIPDSVVNLWRGSPDLAPSRAEERTIRTWLLDVGALHFAGLIADVYRRRALECVNQLQGYSARLRPDRIAGLLPVTD